MTIYSKPFSKEGEKNYERIFGKKPEIDYSENFDEVEKPKQETPIVVNKEGKPIKLTSYQKNSLYKLAKDLKEEIKSALCSKTECWKPTENNVKKMIEIEFKAYPKIDLFKKAMKAIGADPKDYNIDRLRPRR